MFFAVLASAMLLPLPPACAALATTAPNRSTQSSAAADGYARPYPHRRRTRLRSSTTLARCLRLRMLEEREAILHDFIVRVGTEQPQFGDSRSYRLDVGASVGPVLVTRDFVGSPIIRARVTNLKPGDLSFLLSATLESARGTRSGASAVVFLHGHETRTVELLCPDDVAPRSLTWSTMPL